MRVRDSFLFGGNVSVPVLNTTVGLLCQIGGEDSIKGDVTVQTFYDMREKRYQKSLPRQKMKLVYKYLSVTDRAYLATFYETTAAGKLNSFYVYLPPNPCDPTGTSTTGRVLVRFDMDQLTFKHATYRGLYDCDMELIEVYA